MRKTIYLAVETGRRWAVCPHDVATGDTDKDNTVRSGFHTYEEALHAARQMNRKATK